MTPDIKALVERLRARRSFVAQGPAELMRLNEEAAAALEALALKVEELEEKIKLAFKEDLKMRVLKEQELKLIEVGAERNKFESRWISSEVARQEAEALLRKAGVSRP